METHLRDDVFAGESVGMASSISDGPGELSMRRVLFICEGNVHRNRTAADLYSRMPGMEVRSAGLAESARVQVCPELLYWADLVFVMERRLVRFLRRRFKASLADKNEGKSSVNVIVAEKGANDGPRRF